MARAVRSPPSGDVASVLGLLCTSVLRGVMVCDAGCAMVDVLFVGFVVCCVSVVLLVGVRAWRR